MYKERRRVLDGDDMKESVLNMMKETVANHVYQVISDELPPEEWDLAALNAEKKNLKISIFVRLSVSSY